ncbi:S8 family serine peptidase [Hymenobacter profundi]|uniref:S8 family serine peptidase n=1 Tax=Hymenobacter profundi TaxID=1982110 RepID=A0ABS6X567_9BACT|nr:S8 family serine peptidase [Hymenobacter profundi]
MSKRIYFLCCQLLLGVGVWLPSTGKAQAPTTRYWVQLRDKKGVDFNPKAYFVPAALARRVRQHLPTADSTDYPVRPAYLHALSATADSVTLVSRWLNGVVCRATPAQAQVLRRLPGVLSVTLLPERQLQLAAHTTAAEGASMQISTVNRQLARRQTESLGAVQLRRAHLNGRGLRIAIFDAGFNGVDSHPAFEHLRTEKRIVATYDFLKRQPNVYHGANHGGEVLSCVAGALPDGSYLGLAPGAEFLLARTEQMFRERYAEEEAWLAAAEWADRQGVDIINSSLGYTNRRYFPEQMNGYISLIARAAEMAARKGILVVNAAGNDGEDEEWHTIGTPADGDSVLTVGGLDPDTYLHSDFSSYGPGAGRRLKPNVVAFGTALVAAPGGYERIEGTSFASPLMVGLAACVWQQQRQLTAMEVFRKLEKAGELYPYYDYAHGYGRPQIASLLAPSGLAATPAPTFDFVRHDSVVAVVIRVAAATVPARTLPLYADSVRAVTPAARPNEVPALGKESTVPTPETPAEEEPVLQEPPRYLYWHIANRQGVLRRYEVRDVTQRAVLEVPLRLVQPGDMLRVHYRGFTQTYTAAP